MNCPDVQELLSAFYDCELADDTRATVDEHLGRCSDCTREMAGVEKLSVMASGLNTPEPPARIWAQLEKQLEGQPATRPAARKLRWPLPMPRLLALAATILVAIGIGWLAYGTWLGAGEHDHLAVDFGQYLEQFEDDATKAHQVFAAKYGGQALDIGAAAKQLGYRPAVADGLPAGFTLVSTHVMKMPCCTCLGSLCQRDDGSTFAIFEHNEEQPVWFGDRPAISADCCGKRCSLMQVESDLIAGWQQGSRHITVIGARNLEEVNQLVAWLARASAHN